MSNRLRPITINRQRSFLPQAGFEGGKLFVEAYCLKCRVKREMSNPNPITMKNGKPATEGKCPTCGTKMFKIGKA